METNTPETLQPSELIKETIDPETGKKKITLDLDKVREEARNEDGEPIKEIFFAEDMREGLRVELHSHFFKVHDLAHIGTGAFLWMKRRRADKEIKDLTGKNNYIG